MGADKIFLAHPERFERPTLWFVAKYSIQLSYGCSKDADCRQFGQRRQAAGAKFLRKSYNRGFFVFMK